MDKKLPIYLIHSTQKGSHYKYVASEQEAKKYIHERAEAIRMRLAANTLQKVYTTSDSDNDIKVLIQKVGTVWNSFLKEYVTFTFFPVPHVSGETFEEKVDFEGEDDDDLFFLTTQQTQNVKIENGNRKT